MTEVSVVIPSYNYGAYVSKAVESVLGQRFRDLEVIVVDDGSIDDTAEVIRGIDDKRVHYLYQENRGLPAARNTGIRASQGRLLAFLDADDAFHPDKLAQQVAFLDEHPEVGLTYNDRLLVDASGKRLWWRRAPETVTLHDLVTGYPFAPSDVMIRREWVFAVGLYDESFVANSEDLNFHLRLMLEGCRFCRVPGALGYRQIRAGRRFGNIPGKMETYLRALDTVFHDGRCPDEVAALRDRAYAEHYLIWGVQAATQGEEKLAREYLVRAVNLDPGLAEKDGRALGQYLVHAAVRDGSDAGEALEAIFAGLPPLQWLRVSKSELVGRAYLRSGMADLLWDYPERGERRIGEAARHGAQLDAELVGLASDQLAGRAAIDGETAAMQTCNELCRVLQSLRPPGDWREIASRFQLDEAFRQYRAGEYREVTRLVVGAAQRSPSKLMNRGVLAITLRSLWKEAQQWKSSLA